MTCTDLLTAGTACVYALRPQHYRKHPRSPISTGAAPNASGFVVSVPRPKSAVTSWRRYRPLTRRVTSGLVSRQPCSANEVSARLLCSMRCSACGFVFVVSDAACFEWFRETQLCSCCQGYAAISGHDSCVCAIQVPFPEGCLRREQRTLLFFVRAPLLWLRKIFVVVGRGSLGATTG